MNINKNNKNFESMFISAATGEGCSKILEWIEDQKEDAKEKKIKLNKSVQKSGRWLPFWCFKFKNN